MKKILFFIVFLWFSQSSGNTFSEVFGSEGAAGIENPKTRSLSYTLQYFTLTGSIGYAAKKLHDSGFFEPFGFTPNTFDELSPLAYKKNFLLDNHSANIIGVKNKVEKINYYNDIEKKLFNKRFSSTSIEMRNNRNLIKSLQNFDDRKFLIERYNDK